MTTAAWQPHDGSAASRVVRVPTGLGDLVVEASAATGLA